jgi:hypothetical protein
VLFSSRSFVEQNPHDSIELKLVIDQIATLIEEINQMKA